MKFYCPGRHQAATQIGAYFALPETIKRYQNEEIEPLGGEQRSRPVALQVLAMFPTCGSRCGSKLSHTLTHRLNWSKSKEKVLFSRENRTFWSCWADSNRRPHPYQKAVNAFVLCPFMPIKALQSLVLQGVGGLFAVEKFYWIPIWIMWI